MEIIKNKLRKSCTVKNINKRLPITKWLPKYTAEDLIGDFIAGLTVGLTIVPQGIAFAFIAGLPTNYGLYSSFMSAFVYVIFGNCKQNSIGPTVAVALLTYEYARGNHEIAILFTFTSGIIILIFGILNLGTLLNFLAKPVISGFTSAVAVNVASSQLKSLFGLRINPEGILDTWVKTYQHIGETIWQDFTLGFTSIIVLLIIMKIRILKRFQPKISDTSSEKMMKKMVFLFSAAKNAIIVIIGASIAMSLDNNQPFTLTGDILPGLPSLQLPPFSTNNGTTSFLDIMSNVGTGIIIIPLVAILEGIAIANTFSRGKIVDSTQELIALGICNLASSFVQSFPNAGAVTRASLSNSSGVRTPAGGIVTGTIVILALVVMMPYCRYIPKASLAAILICSSIAMIKYKDIIPMWQVRKADQLVFWTSFLVCIFWRLEYGIIVGALFNLVVSFFHYANPKVYIFQFFESESRTPHIIVEPRQGVLYFNVDYLRMRITKAGLKEGKGIFPVIVDCSHFSMVDFSGSKGMLSLCMDFAQRDQVILFMDASPAVSSALRALNKHILIIDHENLIDALQSIPSKAYYCKQEISSFEEANKLICNKDETLTIGV